MRAIIAVGLATSLAVACGGKSGADDDDGDGGNSPDACVGIECQVVNCGAMSLPPTSISGTVFAPNGTLPLNNVNVYVPRDPLPPFVQGVTCDRCAVTLPGSPVAQAISDESGNFRIDNVPAGANIPLVITTGKWRRQIVIPSVSQCGDNAVGSAETRLPKNAAEGDIPNIAITTGNADSLECLIRKLGIDDGEIGKTGDAKRIHLYSGNGTNTFKAGFPGATGAIPSATPFWSTAATLNAYDIVILSCEGNQNPNTKPQAALDAMKAYADIGGRVFASHWHNIWVGGNFQGNPALAPAVWNTIATWDAGDGNPGDPVAIDEINNPKGSVFANWMINVMGSGPGTSPNPTTRGQVTLQANTRRATSVTLDLTRAERWVFAPQNNDSPQMFQFTTPNEAVPDTRCGKVVFTDMHVSGGPIAGQPYPDSCAAGALTPQEKALAFMFFDIASCVGGLF